MDRDFYRIADVSNRMGALKWKPNLAWAIVISMVFVSTLMILGRPTEFLYFRF